VVRASNLRRRQHTSLSMDHSVTEGSDGLDSFTTEHTGGWWALSVATCFVDSICIDIDMHVRYRKYRPTVESRLTKLVSFTNKCKTCPFRRRIQTVVFTSMTTCATRSVLWNNSHRSDVGSHALRVPTSLTHARYGKLEQVVTPGELQVRRGS